MLLKSLRLIGRQLFFKQHVKFQSHVLSIIQSEIYAIDYNFLQATVLDLN